MAVAFASCIYAVGFAIGAAHGYHDPEESPFLFATFIVVALPMQLPFFALLVRRVHDIGLPGWCMFVPLVIFFAAFAGSQKRENRWGPVPTGVHVQRG